MIQLTVWSLPSIAAMAMTAHALALTRRTGDTPGALPLIGLCLCVMIWSGGQLLGTLTTTTTLKLIAAQIQYPGIALLPVAWMTFALTYLRRRRLPHQLTLAALLVIPVLTITLAWTNEWHGLLWQSFESRAIDGYVGLAIVYGPWFPLHTTYAYVLVGTGTLLLVFELSGSRRHRRALAAVVLGPAIVAACNLIYLTGWNPFPYFDPTPLGFAIGSVLLTRGVLRSGLLTVSPTLHRQVVEQFADGVLVLDGDGRVVDANPAARGMLAPREGALLGRAVSELIPDPLLVELYRRGSRSAEVTIDSQTYHVLASRLKGQNDAAPRTVLVFRDITERLEAENELRRVKQEMERLAHTDALTGLNNRRFFMQRLQEEFGRMQRHGHAMSVLLLDLDRFKDINDTHGHDTGDRMLKLTAAIIDDCKRASDVAARLGGEEFALLLPDTGHQGAWGLAERLREAIASQGIEVDGAQVGVTTSVGVATADTHTATAESMLRDADRALYEAKHAGRNRVRGPTGEIPGNASGSSTCHSPGAM